MNEAERIARERLFSLADEKYKAFQCALMPTVNPEAVIGVRTPLLRKFAAEFYKTGEARDFLASLPHTYYEENNLHAMLIGKLGDFESTARELDSFLPYIDNWATCDLLTPKIFGKHPQELSEKIDFWINSGETYAVRFAVRMIMCFFLEENFRPEYLEKVCGIKSDEYYVQMMIAWFFATALAKQYDSAVIYLEEKRLPVWIHNKTIQKACESFRIPEKTKEYLKTLKLCIKTNKSALDLL